MADLDVRAEDARVAADKASELAGDSLREAERRTGSEVWSRRAHIEENRALRLSNEAIHAERLEAEQRQHDEHMAMLTAIASHGGWPGAAMDVANRVSPGFVGGRAA